MFQTQDRKPLVPDVQIPQSIQEQAEANLKVLGEGEATTEEHQAQIIKAFSLDRKPFLKLIIIINVSRGDSSRDVSSTPQSHKLTDQSSLFNNRAPC